MDINGRHLDSPFYIVLRVLRPMSVVIIIISNAVSGMFYLQVTVMMGRLHSLMKQSMEDDNSSGRSESSKDDRPFECLNGSGDNSPDLTQEEPAERPSGSDDFTAESQAMDSSCVPTNDATCSNGFADPSPGPSEDQKVSPSSSKTKDTLISGTSSANQNITARQTSADVTDPKFMPSSSTLSALSNFKDHLTSGTSISTRIRRSSGKGDKAALPKKSGKTKKTSAPGSRKAKSMKGLSHPEESNSSWSELSYFIIGYIQWVPMMK